MKKYTEQEVMNIPNILKCHWDQEWINEMKKPQEYIGKLAILTTTKGSGKAPKGVWITEGIDFQIV
jgi:hypothetical protein